MSKVMTAAPPQPEAEAPPLSVPYPGTVAERLALVVAPSTGRFRPHDPAASGRAGDLLGYVTGGRGRADEVRLPVDGHLRSLLVRPGQVVRKGQCLAWLERSVDDTVTAEEEPGMSGQMTVRRTER